jgi:hypothetical protein
MAILNFNTSLTLPATAKPPFADFRKPSSSMAASCEPGSAHKPRAIIHRYNQDWRQLQPQSIHPLYTIECLAKLRFGNKLNPAIPFWHTHNQKIKGGSLRLFSIFSNNLSNIPQKTLKKRIRQPCQNPAASEPTY